MSAVSDTGVKTLFFPPAAAQTTALLQVPMLYQVTAAEVAGCKMELTTAHPFLMRGALLSFIV